MQNLQPEKIAKNTLIQNKTLFIIFRQALNYYITVNISMNENSIVIHVMNVIYCAHRLQDIAILLEIQISRCYSLI